MPVVNVASVPHRSPFRYPGGKTWLVPYMRQWLKSLPAKPAEIAEPFAGGGIVGLSALFEELAERLTLVELDEHVAAVWNAMLGTQGNDLAGRIVSFNLTRQAVEAELLEKPRSTLDKAFQTILRNRVQRGGIMAPGAGLIKKGENGHGLSSRWYPETLEKRIKAIVEKRSLITFVEGDGIKFIRQQARRTDMAFFIDPPYTVAGRRLYAHSEISHKRLFRLVAAVKGDFLMTYDDAEPIRKLAERFKLDTHRIPMKNTHHAIMHELLIGRDLTWARKPLELVKNPALKNVETNGHACS